MAGHVVMLQSSSQHAPSKGQCHLRRQPSPRRWQKREPIPSWRLSLPCSCRHKRYQRRLSALWLGSGSGSRRGKRCRSPTQPSASRYTPKETRPIQLEAASCCKKPEMGRRHGCRIADVTSSWCSARANPSRVDLTWPAKSVRTEIREVGLVHR